jgi:hypothetical protein
VITKQQLDLLYSELEVLEKEWEKNNKSGSNQLQTRYAISHKLLRHFLVVLNSDSNSRPIDRAAYIRH